MGLGAGTPSVSHQSHPRAVPSPSPRSSFIRPRLGSARLLAAWHGAAWQSLSPAVPPPSARCDRAETPLPRRDGAAAAWPVGSCGSRHGRGTGTRGGGHGWEWERGDGTRGDGNVAVARVGVGVGGNGYAWRSSVGAWHGGCAHCGVLCPSGMLLWVRSSRGAGAVSALGVPTPWDGGGGTVWGCEPVGRVAVGNAVWGVQMCFGVLLSWMPLGAPGALGTVGGHVAVGRYASGCVGD